MSSERRIARHTGWLLAGHVLMTVMLLTQAIILTRTLGAAGYGVLVLVMTYVVTLRELLDSRVWEPILKFVPQFQAEDRDDRAGGVVLFCWLLQAATAVVTLAIVWVTADLAATLLTGDAEVGGAIRLYAISVLLAVPIHPASALARLADRPAWLSGQRVAVVAAQLVATIVAVVVGPTLHLLVVAQLAGAGVGAILAMVMTVAASRRLSLTVRTSDLRALAGRYRTLIRFCVMTNLTGCSRVIAGRADVLLLGWLGSAAQVGVYDIARNLTTQLREVFGPLHMSIMPEMSVVAAEGRLETLRRLRRRLTIVMTAIAVPLCVVGTLATPWVVPLVFGSQFEPSVLLVQILLWHLLWLPAIWIPSDLLVAGRVGTLTAMSWSTAVVYVALLAILVPTAGAVGAAAATTAYYLLYLAVSVWVFRRVNRRAEPAPDVTVADRLAA